ncbi:hypothetical protein lerEdw1_019575 [Lerista edwardsae]|nr:hypothetical protein lerEdw1_019575 [Lerista edwardsae]
MDHGKQFGIELLKQKLKGYTFEDWNGLEQFRFAQFNYTLSGLTVDNVEFPETRVSFISGTGIRLLFKNVTATVSGDWRISNWLLENEGRATITISGVFITAVVSVSRDETGHPSWLLKSCQSVICDLDIQLDEESSWLYKYFVNFLKMPAHSRLNKDLCPYIKDEIQRLSMEYSQRPALIQIDSFAQIDSTLTSSPTVFETHIDMDLKGTVYPAGNNTEPPFKPASFTLPDKKDAMLYIGISEYFFQTASLAYYTSGAFNISAVEEIAERYAEPHPIMMNLVATAAPVISLRPGRFNLELAGSMDVLAVLPNSTQTPLFTLNIRARTHASLTIFQQKLVSALCLDSFQLSLAHSNVGFFKVSRLESFLAYILQNGVIPITNVYLKNGFPIPNLDKAVLVESAVKVHQGYLLISTDVNFKL